MYRFNWFFAFILVSFPILEQAIWAAPCCARGSATPNLVVGDDEAQISFGFSHASVAAEVGDGGRPRWVSRDYSEFNQNLRMDGAILISDRWQLGAGLSFVRHSISAEKEVAATTALGDSRINLGYEVLPYWNYSAWRPQGYLFTSLNIPTGTSMYNYTNPLGSDITGSGFFSLSVGSLLLKRWSQWDAFLIPEVHYAVPKRFTKDGDSQFVEPGFGGSIGLGGGFSPLESAFRFGFRIQPRFDQPRNGSFFQNNSKAGWITSCDVGLDASMILGATDTVIVSYTDQTWIGPARYSNLNQTFAINLQHRWER
jgi:hypothetical protein